MKEERLRYLAEIDRHRSISKAAGAMYLSQASMSAALKNAEDELGIALFQRSRFGVEPTLEGGEALRLIGEINALSEQVHAIRDTEDLSAYRVQLMVSPSVAHGLLLPLFCLYREAEPNGMLECRIVSGEKIGAGIIKNECNIGLSYLTREELKRFTQSSARFQIRTESVMRDRLYYLSGHDRIGEEGSGVSLGRVSGMSFAMLPHFNSSENAMVYVRNLNPDNRYTVYPSVAHIKHAVRENAMAAVLSGFALRSGSGAPVDRCAIHPLQNLTDRGEMTMYLIYRKEEFLTDAEKKVLTCIRSFFAGVREKADDPGKTME